MTDEVVNLAWPSWWSDEAEFSSSARAELRFTLARKLGLDAKALLEDDEPRFINKVGTFKNLSATASETQRDAIISYATSVARVLLASVPEVAVPEITPQGIRALLLRTSPFVGLQNLLGFCWALGIPVVQLRVFPLRTKKMCAMVVRVRNRHVIFLARESQFPARIAYYIAHELGHIALAHLEVAPVLVDMEDPLSTADRSDPHEVAADRFALEVLTGTPDPEILTEAVNYSAAALAKAVVAASSELQIEPGTLALCFGHSTRRWDKVSAAMKRIYEGVSVGDVVNHYALTQMAAGSISDENEDYVRAAMGLSHG